MPTIFDPQKFDFGDVTLPPPVAPLESVSPQNDLVTSDLSGLATSINGLADTLHDVTCRGTDNPDTYVNTYVYDLAETASFVKSWSAMLEDIPAVGQRKRSLKAESTRQGLPEITPLSGEGGLVTEIFK